MYTIYMYINVWPALIRSMKKEARRIEKQWTFNDYNENVPTFDMSQTCTS